MKLPISRLCMLSCLECYHEEIILLISVVIRYMSKMLMEYVDLTCAVYRDLADNYIIYELKYI